MVFPGDNRLPMARGYNALPSSRQAGQPLPSQSQVPMQGAVPSVDNLSLSTFAPNLYGPQMQQMPQTPENMLAQWSSNMASMLSSIQASIAALTQKVANFNGQPAQAQQVQPGLDDELYGEEPIDDSEIEDDLPLDEEELDEDAILDEIDGMAGEEGLDEEQGIEGAEDPTDAEAVDGETGTEGSTAGEGTVDIFGTTGTKETAPGKETTGTEQKPNLSPEEAKKENMKAVASQAGDFIKKSEDAFHKVKDNQGWVGDTANGIKNFGHWISGGAIGDNGSTAVQEDFDKFKKAGDELKDLADKGDTEGFKKKYKELFGFEYDEEHPNFDGNHPVAQAQARFGSAVDTSIKDLEKYKNVEDMDDRLDELKDIQSGNLDGKSRKDAIMHVVNELQENLDGKDGKEGKKLGDFERKAIQDAVNRLKETAEKDGDTVDALANSIVGKAQKKNG